MNLKNVNEFVNFIKKSKEICETTASDPDANVHLVIGNEACDADSAVCALVYAYYKHQTRTDETLAYIPVLNIPAAEFSLKTEVVYMLKQMNLDIGSLVFTDCMPPNPSIEGISLVDHNVLTVLRLPNDLVSDIIDHHIFSEDYNPRIQTVHKLVGSCATLIGDIILNDTNYEMEDVICQLLLDVILIDTVNFSDVAARATDLDYTISDILSAKLGPDYDMDNRFQELMVAKADVSSLSNFNLLRKDAKIVKTETYDVIISSVPIHMKEFLSRDDIISTLIEYNKKYSAVVVMSISILPTGLPCRQIAMYSSNSSLLNERMHGLVINHRCHRCPQLCVSLDTPLFKLQKPEFDIPVNSKFECFEQSVKCSRKQVLPAIAEYLNNNKPRNTTR